MYLGRTNFAPRTEQGNPHQRPFKGPKITLIFFEKKQHRNNVQTQTNWISTSKFPFASHINWLATKAPLPLLCNSEVKKRYTWSQIVRVTQTQTNNRTCTHAHTLPLTRTYTCTDLFLVNRCKATRTRGIYQDLASPMAKWLFWKVHPERTHFGPFTAQGPRNSPCNTF